MGTELANLDSEKLKELVVSLPAEKRAAFSKAAKAAIQHLKDQGENYKRAYELAVASMENWRRLGAELPAIIKHGGHNKQNRRRDVAVLKELGINLSLSSRCQKLASLSDEAFREWVWSHYEETRFKFPSLTSGAKRADKARKTAAIGERYPVEIRQGDFREVLSDLDEIGAIVTDPPYGKDYLQLWQDLGRFASDRLVVGGVVIAYSGQMYLPEVLQMLSLSLDYYWMLCVTHEGSGNLTPLGQPVRKVINCWKPLVFFVNADDGYDDTFRDRVPGELPSKEMHNWAQPVSEAAWLIENFTDAGSLVVDPFAGSGTVAKAAEETGRRFIGAEIL